MVYSDGMCEGAGKSSQCARCGNDVKLNGSRAKRLYFCESCGLEHVRLANANVERKRYPKRPKLTEDTDVANRQSGSRAGQLKARKRDITRPSTPEVPEESSSSEELDDDDDDNDDDEPRLRILKDMPMMDDLFDYI